MDLFFWTDKQFGTIKMYSIKKRTNNFFYKLNQMELCCETFYKKTFFSINVRCVPIDTVNVFFKTLFNPNTSRKERKYNYPL